MKSLYWQKVDIPNKMLPSARSGHATCYLHDREQILLFGGMSKTRSSEVFLFDIESSKWSHESTTGRVPTPRCYHALWYDPPYVYLHGGQGDKRRSVGDLFVLNVDTFIWKRIFVIESPSAREHHSAVKVGNEFILYGGCSSPENYALEDVWSLNTTAVAWNTNPTNLELPGAVWTKHKPKGNFQPGARKGHRAIPHEKFLVIFGGELANGEKDNSVFQLNTENMAWSKAHVLGQPPSPRAFHSMCLLKDNTMAAVFGGLESPMNSEKIHTLQVPCSKAHVLMHWSAPFCGGQLPSSRYLHTMVSGNFTDRPDLFVLGGMDAQFCNMEFFKLKENTGSDENPFGHDEDSASKSLEMAEKIIIDQKKEIGKLEERMHELRQENIALEKWREEKLHEKYEVEKSVKDTQKILEDRLESAEAENASVTEKLEQCYQLFLFERGYRKIFQKKTDLLEDCFKRAESLLITLDYAYNILRPGEAVMEDEDRQRHEDINNYKAKHHDSLLKLKEFYQNSSTDKGKFESGIKEKESLFNDLRNSKNFECNNVLEDSLEM
eukprot:CAMPEP_0114984108 /NCGR_PEP_ID=MMETSP0216-20121206/7083_1 /TAXON_ID=223996 /ORGANISM="Protocruzia adherens, Strain Boccale" /LENGTH=550 /DNA_ID=CAMNT_0002346187 /DNA_START=205 /DNA_END=1857 /DNA_ORIENTATION=-